MSPTRAEIDAAMTANGGWTRETLNGWGVKWPPKAGWKKKLIEASAAQSLMPTNTMRETLE